MKASHPTDVMPDGRNPSAAHPEPLVRVLLLGVCAALAFFLLGEWVERTWLADADMKAIHLSHAVRGIVSSLVLAGFVAWLIVARSPEFMGAAKAFEEEAPTAQAGTAERLQTYTFWFISMRWIAVVMAAILVFISVQLVGWLPKAVWWPLVSAVAALAGFNLACTLLARRGRGLAALLVAQADVDLAILTALLHFSGGIENPLSMMMIFHIIISGILLSRRQCYRIALVASLWFALLAWAEGTEMAEHYTLQLFPHFAPNDGEAFHPAHHPVYAASRVVLQAVVLMLTAYFVAALAERLRENERRLAAAADGALAGQRQLAQALKEQKEAQAQIVRAGRLAAVGELAGQIAHEVNNPVAIIDAKARLLLCDRRGEMSPKVAQELVKITELSTRVARIAQGLLSYCRPSPGTRTALDVRQPARLALALIEPRARALGVVVNDALPPAPLTVMANSQELEQVFLNLFLNALDAMPGGGSLDVSARTIRAGDGAAQVAVTVADTGSGIPAGDRERIFEPFFTTKQEGRGTGLGLSICLGLVRSHGGEVGVESESGRGARFTVRLPATAAAGKERAHG